MLDRMLVVMASGDSLMFTYPHQRGSHAKRARRRRRDGRTPHIAFTRETYCTVQ